MTKLFIGDRLMLYGGAARALRPKIEQRYPDLPIIAGNRRDLGKMRLDGGLLAGRLEVPGRPVR